MIKIISKQELLEKIESGEKFLLLDVRDTPDYKKGHIKGALNILISQIENRIKSIAETNDLIITYSKDINCPASGIAAEKLVKLGFTNVIRYKGGWKEWKESKLPVESV